jgi:hypothetical protein
MEEVDDNAFQGVLQSTEITATFPTFLIVAMTFSEV